MKVSLKNVGMLDEANFEVGDLTIICGENNTGKTYATYSLYGYLDYIKRGSFLNLTLKDSEYSKLLEEVVIEDCKFEIVMQSFENILTKISHAAFDEYKEQLPEILAGKDVDFTKTEFADDIVKRAMAIFNKTEKIAKDFFLNSGKFELLEINKEKIIFDFSKSKKTFTDDMKRNIDFKKDMFIKAIILYIYTFSYPNTFIISAERTGASMFQKELDVNKSEIVEQISMADTNNIQDVAIRLLMQRYSRYPKPVKDNIYFIRGLNEVTSKTSFISKNESALNKIILELLHKVVGGKYLVSQEGIEFAPGAKKRIIKGKVAIQRASSSVRSLLMLNYYILHMARVGDILMIDEPELNLHPNNQILVARLLVLLVNSGIKVFITTHSDYIVREISNCIMLNCLTSNQIDNLRNKGYSSEYKLNFKKVKAYLAENKKGKNILGSVVINEQGIFMNTFDSPIDTQNENQSLIFAALLEGNKNDE